MELIGYALVAYTLVHLYTHVRPKRAFAQSTLQVPTSTGPDAEMMSISITLFDSESRDQHFDKIKKAGDALSSRIQQNNDLMLAIQAAHKEQFEEKKKAQESEKANLKPVS